MEPITLHSMGEALHISSYYLSHVFKPVSYTHLDVYKRQGVGNVQLLGYLCCARCVRVADCGQLCAGDIVCDILCVLIAQTTQKMCIRDRHR